MIKLFSLKDNMSGREILKYLIRLRNKVFMATVSYKYETTKKYPRPFNILTSELKQQSKYAKLRKVLKYSRILLDQQLL